MAVPVPADPLCLAELVREDEHLHPKVEERVGFGVVEEVELHSHILPGVCYPEEEPLGVPLRVDVIGEDKVILGVTELESHAQVPRFKARFKHQSLIVLIVWCVIRKYYRSRCPSRTCLVALKQLLHINQLDHRVILFTFHRRVGVILVLGVGSMRKLRRVSVIDDGVTSVTSELGGKK